MLALLIERFPTITQKSPVVGAVVTAKSTTNHESLAKAFSAAPPPLLLFNCKIDLLGLVEPVAMILPPEPTVFEAEPVTKNSHRVFISKAVPTETVGVLLPAAGAADVQFVPSDVKTLPEVPGAA